MAEVNPFDIEFAEDDEKYSKPSYTGSRGGGLYKKSLKALEKERERNKIRKEYPSLTDEQADELIEMRKRNKGMLDWSEDLQRAVMTEEMKKSHPEMSDEEIQERVDYQMGGVDVEDYEEIKKPDINNSTDEEWVDYFTKVAKRDNPDWTDEQARQYGEYSQYGGETPGFAKSYENLIGREMRENSSDISLVDVPEIETEVVDLPPEDENEKEIKIDRNPDDTIVDPDKTLAEEVTPDLPEGEDLTVIDNDPEDVPDIVTDEEVAALDNQEETKPIQEEEKQEKPAADETKSKQEEEKTSSGYDRYPTGVRVGEDILGEVNTVASGVKDAAEKIGKQGANSGSISNEVARAVPHYDYRSLFR